MLCILCNQHLLASSQQLCPLCVEYLLRNQCPNEEDPSSQEDGYPESDGDSDLDLLEEPRDVLPIPSVPVNPSDLVNVLEDSLVSEDQPVEPVRDHLEPPLPLPKRS